MLQLAILGAEANKRLGEPRPSVADFDEMKLAGSVFPDPNTDDSPAPNGGDEPEDVLIYTDVLQREAEPAKDPPPVEDVVPGDDGDFD